MKVIDCRCRPDTPEFLATLNNPHLRNDMRKLGTTPPTRAVSLDEFIRRFETEGISQIVCMGRDMASTGGAQVDNEYVAKLMRESNGKLVGIAGIDPLKPDAHKTVEHCIDKLGLKGVSMDPAFMDLYCDDPVLYPVYQKCSDLGVPVFLTLGPRLFGHGTRLCYCDPMPIDHVAADFPRLKLLVSHGGFPWMQEMIAIAYRNDNVWMETSSYWFMPGVADMIVQAANSILADRICFGTAYPFQPMGATLKRFLELPFSEEVLPAVLAGNISELLGLD